MNQTLFLSQLRVIILVGIAYSAGKGWLSPADSSAITSVLAPIGVIAGPWIWSIYSNINMKLVPHGSIAINPLVNQVQDPGLQRGVLPKVGDTAIIAGTPAPNGTLAVKVVGALLLAVTLALLAFPQGASAAQRQTNGMPCDLANLLPGCSQSSGSSSAPTNVLDAAVKALSKPFTDLANFIGDDNAGAVSLSTAVPEIQDGHGQQCWMAMSSFGKIVKAHPVPLTFHVTIDFETLRLLGIATNNLCSNVHCTQVFADANAMAQAASPVPLIIPSLHDLCAKVPQIAVVAPVTVPAPAAAPADLTK